jgi:hypothetical protein
MEKTHKNYRSVYLFYGEKYTKHQQDSPLISKVVNRFKQIHKPVSILIYSRSDDPTAATMLRVHKASGFRSSLPLVGSKGQVSSSGVGLASFAEKCEKGEQIIAES